jgi:hypothetical protein
MANEPLNEMLQFFPHPAWDPVPPWLYQALDRVVLRDLAVISLERTRATAEINNRAIEQAIGVLKKAKF